jgi:hypothetical protein
LARKPAVSVNVREKYTVLQKGSKLKKNTF